MRESVTKHTCDNCKKVTIDVNVPESTVRLGKWDIEDNEPEKNAYMTYDLCEDCFHKVLNVLDGGV